MVCQFLKHTLHFNYPFEISTLAPSQVTAAIMGCLVQTELLQTFSSLLLKEFESLVFLPAHPRP